MLKSNEVYFFDLDEFEDIIEFYLNTQKLSLAKKAVRLGLKQHPEATVLKQYLADIFVEENKFELAIEVMNDLKSQDSENEEIYIQFAEIASRQNNHKIAINNLNKALTLIKHLGYESHDDESKESYCDIYNLLAYEYLMLESYSKAIVYYKKSLAIFPDDVMTLSNIVHCYTMLEEFENSITILNNYIEEITPYNEVVWHLLGSQYYMTGSFKKSLEAFNYAILIKDDFIGAYIERAKVYEELGEFEQAIESYTLAIRVESPSSYIFLRMGHCYLALEKQSKARQFYKKSLYEDPNFEDAFIAIAKLEIDSKNYNEALLHLKKVLEINPTEVTYWSLFGTVNLNLGNYEECAIAFKKCTELDKDNLTFWLGLSDLHHFIGDQQDSLEILQDAKEKFGDLPVILYRIACNYILLKNKEGIVLMSDLLQIHFDVHETVKIVYPKVFKLKSVKTLIKIHTKSN